MPETVGPITSHGWNKLVLSAQPRPTAFTTLVRQTLLERGYEFVAESAPPSQVDITLCGTAAIASLHFPKRIHRLVVKSTASHLGLRNARQLAAAVRVLTGSDLEIARSFPTILGFDEGAHLIVFEYINGETLNTDLYGALRRPTMAAVCESHLRQAAVTLSRVQELPARNFVGSMPVRRNASFLAGFEEMASPFSTLFRKAGFATPAHFLGRLTADFLARATDRLFLIDACTKNILVRAAGGLCFIDLDFSPGTPGLGMAAFLVALDRLGSRYPYQAQQAQIAEWKRTFLQAYAARSGGFIAEELAFFYPWTLLEMFSQHRNLRPAFTPYLRWYYGRHLVQFLMAVSRASLSDLMNLAAMPFQS